MVRILVLFALLVVSISCSRSVNTEANLSFQFKNIASGPSASAASSGFYPAKVIINVKFDGQNHFQEWDCPQSHSGSGNISSCTLPTSISISRSFPSGGNRLVQVLLVYENENENLEFFYSDKTLAFSGGVANVVVGDAGWEHSASPSQVRVQGRLASTTVNTDTLNGRVVGLYQPQNAAKPPMAVIQDTIFGGWFDFMFLSGVKFTYIHKDSGKVLFDKKSAEDIAVAASVDDSQVLKVKIPNHRVVEQYHERVSYTPTLSLGYWSTSIAGLNFLFDDQITIANGANYMYMNSGADILNMTFPASVNPGSVELTYDTLGPVSTSFNISDAAATVITTMNISEGAPAQNGTKLVGLYDIDANAGIKLSLPNDPNIRITEIALTKINHVEYFVPQQYSYVGFFSIEAQSFLPENDAENGVNYSNTSGHYYNGSNGTISIREGALSFTNGVWVNKSSDLADINNFIYYEEGSGDLGYNYFLAKTPTAVADNCDESNVYAATCIYVNHENFRAERILGFEGPLKYDLTFNTCSESYPDANCTVHYSLLPGVNVNLQFFRLPNSISLHENENFDCQAMDAAGYGVGSVTTSGQAGLSGLNYSNMSAGKIYYCPYQTVAGVKKYFGWGSKVHYRPN